MVVSVLDQPALDPLLVAEAAAELAQLRRLRAVAAAAEIGRSQRDIAATLRVSQPTVYKMLVRARHTRGLDEKTPWEIVLRYAAGEMSRTTALEELGAWPWRPDQVADPDSPEPAQFEIGDWHDLERAVRFGYLNGDDYDIVLARVQ